MTTERGGMTAHQSEEFERPEPAPYDELSEDDVMALQAENERLRKALELACEDGWDDGQWAMRRYLEMAQASLSGSPVEGTR